MVTRCVSFSPTATVFIQTWNIEVVDSAVSDPFLNYSVILNYYFRKCTFPPVFFLFSRVFLLFFSCTFPSTFPFFALFFLSCSCQSQSTLPLFIFLLSHHFFLSPPFFPLIIFLSYFFIHLPPPSFYPFFSLVLFKPVDPGSSVGTS